MKKAGPDMEGRAYCRQPHQNVIMDVQNMNLS